MDRELVERLIDEGVHDHAAAATLLEEHPELRTARYIHDETPLHFCAVEGLVDGVCFFAKAGFPVDAVNEFGDTALIDATTVGNVEVVRALLQLGANPNATSATRDQVLHIAVSKGSSELAAALLAAGARADYVTSLDETIWDAVPKHSPQREEMLAVLAHQGISQSK
jgi:ankyrin repeat protein